MAYRLAGGLAIAVGLLLWSTMLGLFAFLEAFGGERVSGFWYIIPGLITLGGPILFWVVLPRREEKTRDKR